MSFISLKRHKVSLYRDVILIAVPDEEVGGGLGAIAGGTLTDTTAWHLGKGADGAIVTDAKDEAAFLTALTDGTLLDPSVIGEIGAGDPSGCSGHLVHSGSGAGNGFKSDVVYAVDGSRVAVLLLNGKTPGETGFARATAAANSLYCAA